MDRTPTPPTRRGADAVEAAIEEFELRERIDEPDASGARSGAYDLSWARSRVEAARRAAEADVVSADEALEWIAAEIGRELPTDEPDDDRR
jgi:hypothetical protein